MATSHLSSDGTRNPGKPRKSCGCQSCRGAVSPAVTALGELRGMKPTRFTCRGDNSPLVTDGKDLFCTAGCGRVVLNTLAALAAMVTARDLLREEYHGDPDPSDRVLDAEDALATALVSAGVL